MIWPIPGRLERILPVTLLAALVQSSCSSRMETALRTLGGFRIASTPGRDTHRFTGERISDRLV
jgi:hypothetical protein